MNRKQRRQMEKHVGASASQNLSEKIFQFNKLPDMCSACNKAFDKKDKEMVSSWNVVVRQEAVRVFCPDCIKKAKGALEKMENKNENNETQ